MIDVNLKVKIIAHPSLGFFVFLVFFGQTPAWLVGALLSGQGLNRSPGSEGSELPGKLQSKRGQRVGPTAET